MTVDQAFDRCVHRYRDKVAVTLGVETDVLGQQLDQITDKQRAAVTAAHPRPDFKNRIQRAFYDGMRENLKTVSRALPAQQG